MDLQPGWNKKGGKQGVCLEELQSVNASPFAAGALGPQSPAL